MKDNVIYLDQRYPFRDMPAHYVIIDNRTGTRHDMTATLADIEELADYLFDKYSEDEMLKNFTTFKVKHKNVNQLIGKL